ncbi:MAG: hypothetical protein ACJAQT_001437 [Akkermansiaceae bacterium]
MVGFQGSKKSLVGVSGMFVLSPDLGFLVVEFYEEVWVEELEDVEGFLGRFDIVLDKGSLGVKLVELDGFWVLVEAGYEKLASRFLVFRVEGGLGGESEILHGGGCGISQKELPEYDGFGGGREESFFPVRLRGRISDEGEVFFESFLSEREFPALSFELCEF